MSYHIYKITNKLDGKIYVGCTNNCERRWQYHQSMARHADLDGYRPPVPLYQSMHQHGVESFSLEVLEECTDNLVLARDKERQWIRKLNCKVPYGYNSSVRLLTDEQIAVIRFNVLSLTSKEYAKLFAVSVNTVRVAKTGKGSHWRSDPYAYITRDFLPEDVDSYLNQLMKGFVNGRDN